MNKAVSKLFINFNFGTVLFIMEITSIWKFYLIRKCLKNYKNLPQGVTIVDVRRSDERAAGFVPGSLHISLEENGNKTFLSKLPDTYVIFHCSAGGRALEAQGKAKKGGFTKGVYIDAGVKCQGSDCTFTPNEPLDPSDW